MADMATLNVRVEAKQAIAETRSLGAALNATTASATALDAKLTGLNRTTAASSAQQAARAAAFKAETNRIAAQTAAMSGLGTATVSTASRAATAGTVIAGAFGPGSIAALAITSFGITIVRELMKSRTAMDETRDKWIATLNDMINAGAVFKLKARAQDLFLGTPAEGFTDGIAARRNRIEQLTATRARLEAGRFDGSFVDNYARIRETDARIAAERAALAPLVEQYEALSKAIMDTVNVPFSRTTAEWTITASKLANELSRAARMANELQRVSALLSANTVDSRGRRIGIGASIPTSGFGRTGYTPGDPVMGIPAGIGSGDLTNPQLDFSRRIVAAFDKANPDISRNFAENIQRSVGDFFSDFIATGRVSVRDLFSGLQRIGGDIIGQTLSRSITSGLGNLTTSQSLVAGGGLAVLGSVVTSFLNAGQRARQLAAAFEQTTRSVDAWRMSATETPEQAELRRLQETRDNFARDLVAQSGVTGFSGGIDEARRMAELMARLNFGQMGENGRKLLAALDELEEAFGANTEAARKAAAATKIAALSQTIEGLRGFASGLKLSDLSIYNPFQQQDEARRVYEDVLAKARSGDQGAAAQLPAAARAFLEQSRGINASGSRYVADFQRVEQDTAAVLAEFGNQLDIQQRILDATTSTTENTDRIGDETRRGREAMEMSLTVQSNGFRQVVEQVQLLRAENAETTRELRLMREEGLRVQ